MERKKEMVITARNPEQVGNTLLRYRKLQGWTQKKVGDRAGIKQGIISMVESGTHGTRLETLCKIMAVLDLEFVIRKRQKSE